MEQAKYKHLANFLRQRGQKIPGVPFLSLWQFAAAIGFGFIGYVLQLSLPVVLIVGLAAVITFFVYHGEFVGRRLIAITAVYSLSLFNRRRTVNFERAWDLLAEGTPTAPVFATITLEGKGGATVLS